MHATADETPLPADDRITRIGLLMEAAIAQQRMAEESLAHLQAHTQSIDGVVRDEIRRTLVDELRGVGAESRRAVQSLEAVKRAANLRQSLWSLAVTALCAGLGLAFVWHLVPSTEDISRLRAERDALAAAVARLEHRGGRIDLRRCGDTGRLCVRIDPKAPVYGRREDYRVIQDR